MDFPKPQRFDTIVIGAGISGLCTAHWLKKEGRSVLVLEKDSEVGGTMKTIREGGFLVETGPNSALETTPLFRQLAADCGLRNELIYADPVGKNRFILRDGSLHALPLNPLSFIRSSLFGWKAKFRLLAEPFIGRAGREESVAEFVARRLGSEFLDYAIDPFVAGVFAGKPEELSVRSAFPKLYALEEKYGGLIRGMVGGAMERRRREEKAKDRAESFSFVQGMQSLPAAIARGLGDAVILSAEVDDIQKTASGYSAAFRRSGSRASAEARHVVVSTPAHVAANLLRSLAPGASEALSSIVYTPVASIVLGYRRSDVPHPLDGFGVLVPRKERRHILGALWSSSLFPGRAPDDMAAFTVFMGGARQPEELDRTDEELVTLAAGELARIMQIVGKPVYYRVTRWEKAIPQYVLGYSKTIAKIELSLTETPGLLLCSNFYGGISVGDCLMSARRTSETMMRMPAGPSG